MDVINESNHDQVPLRTSEKPLVRVLNGRVTLNEDISAVNFYSAWFQLIIVAFMFTSIDLLQTIILSDTFKVPDNQIGGVIANIQLIDYGVRLATAIFFGHIVDMFGRKIVFFYSILSVSAGYALIPLQSSIYPGYLLSKLLASQGIIALQMLPLTADYIHDSTKGMASALNYAMGFLGGLLSAVVFYILSMVQASTQETYWTYSGFILLSGIILGFGVKGGTQYYQKQKFLQEVQGEGSCTDVCNSFRRIHWLKIVLIVSILGNADVYVMTTGMPVYVKSLILDQADANIQVGIYIVVFLAFSCGSMMYYAQIMDKVAHLHLLFPLMIIATITFYLIPLVGSGTSPLLYIFMAFEGLTLPGVVSYGTYLATLYSPALQRGRIGGIATSLGIVGAVLMFYIGGFLHDTWREDAPFIVYTVLITISTLIVGVIAIKVQRDYITRGRISSDLEMAGRSLSG